MNRLWSLAAAATAFCAAGCSDNYLGDQLSWDRPVTFYKPHPSGGVDLATTYCLPPKTNVIGQSASMTRVVPDDPTSAGVRSVAIHAPDTQFYLPVRPDHEGAKTCDAAPLPPDQLIYIRKDDLEITHRHFTPFTP